MYSFGPVAVHGLVAEPGIEPVAVHGPVAVHEVEPVVHGVAPAVAVHGIVLVAAAWQQSDLDVTVLVGAYLPVGAFLVEAYHPVGAFPVEAYHPVDAFPVGAYHPVGAFPVGAYHPVGAFLGVVYHPEGGIHLVAFAFPEHFQDEVAGSINVNGTKD